MSGRGRELTLPAWMTASNGQQGPQNLVPAAINPIIPSETTLSSNANSNPNFNAGAIPSASFPLQNSQLPVAFNAPIQQQQQFAPSYPPMQAFIPAPYFPIPKPVGPAPPSKPAPPVIGDPNNDVSLWTEYNSADGRKYWFNRASMVSTYDKPFCLKTPEERSIPPCPWKEYTSDGKKYYSNGTESSWTMPEEYRVWKEKIDAIEKKKLAGPTPPPRPDSAAVPILAEGVAGRVASSESLAKVRKDAEKAVREPVVYASAAESQEAFASMLAQFKISTSAKMKEVQDACQSDPRWDALRSQGEKKQCLAEYQTKQLKLEKELQKTRARKFRDAFLLMLAENTDIDARTRWRDAVLLLQDDSRYKNVEDAREREDLFKDFVLELEKKEKEDHRLLRNTALDHFQGVLDNLHKEGMISRRSVWADSRKSLADVLLKPELKILDETDFRRSFQEFTSQLEEQHRKAERRKREDYLSLLEMKQSAFHSHIHALVTSGALSSEAKWKDVMTTPAVAESTAFKELVSTVAACDVETMSTDGVTACREVFDRVLHAVQGAHKLDKRLVKDLLYEAKVKISHDSKLEDLRALLMKVGRLKEVEKDGAVTLVADRQLAEEGEELEDFPSDSRANTPAPQPVASRESSTRASVSSPAVSAQLRSMLVDRPYALPVVFEELQEIARIDHEDKLRAARKAEERFISLLEETFYLSDHVGVDWEDAKKFLQKRSAYDLVGKSDRKRLFSAHMAELSRKLESKTKLKVNSAAPVPENELNRSGDKRAPEVSGDSDSDGSDSRHREKRQHKKHRSERERSPKHTSGSRS